MSTHKTLIQVISGSDDKPDILLKERPTWPDSAVRPLS